MPPVTSGNRRKRLAGIYTGFSRGANPATRQQEEIDIVASGEKIALFGERGEVKRRPPTN